MAGFLGTAAMMMNVNVVMPHKTNMRSRILLKSHFNMGFYAAAPRRGMGPVPLCITISQCPSWKGCSQDAHAYLGTASYCPPNNPYFL